MPAPSSDDGVSSLKEAMMSFRGARVKVKLTPTHVSWKPVNPVGGCCVDRRSLIKAVPIDEILSAVVLKPGCCPREHTFVVYTFSRKGPRCPNTWRLVEHQLSTATPDLAKDWVTAINARVLAIRDRPRNLLVFINPFAGARLARLTWERHVLPVFQRARVAVNVHETTKQDHARELLEHMKAEELASYQGVVAVGGDGLFQEVVSGLLARRVRGDSTAFRIRVGHVPAGSTDAVAYTLHGSRCATTAALHIALGDRLSLDSGRVEAADGSTRHFVCQAGYGFMGDVMRFSEKLRFMGPGRYDVTGAVQYMRLASYRVQLSYREAPSTTADVQQLCTAQCEVCRMAGIRVQPPTPFLRGCATLAASAVSGGATAAAAAVSASSSSSCSSKVGGASPRASGALTAGGGGGAASGGVFRASPQPAAAAAAAAAAADAAASGVQMGVPHAGGGGSGGSVGVGIPVWSQAGYDADGAAASGGSGSAPLFRNSNPSVPGMVISPMAAAAAAAAPPTGIYISSGAQGLPTPDYPSSAEGSDGAAGGAAGGCGAAAADVAAGKHAGVFATATAAAVAAAAAAGGGGAGTATGPDAGVVAEEGWTTLEGEFVSVMCMVTPCRSEKSKRGIIPNGHLSDGRMYLVLVYKCSHFDFLRFLLRLSMRGLSDRCLPFVRVIPITAMKLTPLPGGHKLGGCLWDAASPESAWNVDGELLSDNTVNIGVTRGALEVFARGVETAVGGG